MRLFRSLYSRLSIACLVTSIVLHTPIASAWELRKDDSGIQVYLQDVSDSDFKAFRGEMTVQVTLHRALSHLLDPAAMTEWLKDCSESELLQRIADDEFIVYQRSDAPWPVSDRDYVYHSRIEQDSETYTVSIVFDALAQADQRTDECVRVTKMTGHWRLRPISSNTLHVQYQIQADPGGSLPAWLANQFVVDQPFDTLRNLRQRMLEGDGAGKVPSSKIKGVPVDFLSHVQRDSTPSNL